MLVSIAARGRATFVARQPMGRLGMPGEIGDLAVYLAGRDLYDMLRRMAPS
jgi:NAD(P)-dependent dehydrogenase (short-subunit alcohol dehydrogenase family)